MVQQFPREVIERWIGNSEPYWAIRIACLFDGSQESINRQARSFLEQSTNLFKSIRVTNRLGTIERVVQQSIQLFHLTVQYGEPLGVELWCNENFLDHSPPRRESGNESESRCIRWLCQDADSLARRH